jgi:hypothetical protein
MAKGEKKSSKKDDTGVLGSLPATRPTRLGRRRAGGEAGAEESSPARAKAPAKRSTPAAKRATASKAKPTKPARSTAGKPKATASSKPTTSAAAKPKAAPTAKPSPSGTSKAKPAAPARPAPVAEVRPRPRTTTERKAGPRPVRSGSPGLDAVPVQERPSDPKTPSGTELVSTVVKAAGEVAQIGLTVGGQILKRAVDRIPKP